MRLQTSTKIVLAEGLLLLVLTGALLIDAIPIGLGHRWILLSVHVLCACLLIGNVCVGAVLLGLADAGGDPRVRVFVSRFVTISDAIFTGPSSLGLVLTGAGLTSSFGGIGDVGWLQASLGAIGASGVVWLGVLVPLQERLYRSAVTGEEARWEKTARIYPIPGLFTVALLLVVLGLMVAKPSL